MAEMDDMSDEDRTAIQDARHLNRMDVGGLPSREAYRALAALSDQALEACREEAIAMVRETLKEQGVEWPAREERYRREWFGRIKARLLAGAAKP